MQRSQINQTLKINAQNSPTIRDGNAQNSYQEINNRTVHLSQIYFNVLSQLK